MIIGTGIDLEPIARIENLTKRYEDSELEMIFTKDELKQCRTALNPGLYYTICFSTKESVGKSLGTGLSDINWIDIEAIIFKDKVRVNLYNNAERILKLNRITKIVINWEIIDRHVLTTAIASR
ncbi:MULTISPECIES: holo-ACP synthase [unclassified Priestia]|uniref:holo-ACP synthase n=1 Tax=Priestia TaxID=2800373 RepID=UPI000D3E19F2|nr:ACP synthase [Priestia megaterium]